jgi:protoheme IX farnesyltransferase
VIAIPLPRAAPADFLELTKPRIVALVLVTVAAGFAAAPSAVVRSPMVLLHTLVGAALVAAGTNALNQVLERDVDALMKRTARRPLPSGRLRPTEAAWFAWSAGLVGIVYLALLVNSTTALLAAATLGSYVFLYTPLKRRSSVSTLVGAVPGALPILGGWAAAGAALDSRALVLFWILFLWQLPHFLALSWMYRDDYSRGGLQMLSVADPDGKATFRQATLYALALVPASLAPAIFGMAGPAYFVVAFVLSALYVGAAATAMMTPSVRGARRLFLTSLVYLPVILGLLTLDGVT